MYSICICCKVCNPWKWIISPLPRLRSKFRGGGSRKWNLIDFRKRLAGWLGWLVGLAAWSTWVPVLPAWAVCLDACLICVKRKAFRRSRTINYSKIVSPRTHLVSKVQRGSLNFHVQPNPALDVKGLRRYAGKAHGGSMRRVRYFLLLASQSVLGDTITYWFCFSLPEIPSCSKRFLEVFRVPYSLKHIFHWLLIHEL